MNIALPGVDPVSGNHVTSGPKVAFTFAHRGQAAVRMRLAYATDKPAIVHPMPSGGQPRPRSIAAGSYIVLVHIDAMDLPGLPVKSIDSDLLVNGVLVLQARGQLPDGQNVDRDGAIFRLIVT